jgi:hypothetical protein
MSVFSKKSASSFKQESNELLGIFSKVHNKLNSLIIRQKEYVEEVQQEIDHLKEEQDLVNTGITENSVILSNIGKLLGK